MSDKKDPSALLKAMEASICLHQWDSPCVNFASGKVRACCRIYPRPLSEVSLQKLGSGAIFNDYHNRERRLDMLKGNRHEECQSCWALEDKGAPSPRIGLPQFLSRMQDRLKVSEAQLIKMMVEPEKYPHILESHHPFELEISFGNHCDLACTYCTYLYSSRIAKEDIAAGKLDKEFYEKETRVYSKDIQHHFWDWFQQDGIQHLQVIHVIGGEPLISDLFYEYLAKLVDVSKKMNVKRKNKIILQIVTNLNAPPHYLDRLVTHLPELSQYFDVSLLASVESVEARSEYIRFGSSWNRFTKNVDTILSTSKMYLYQFGFLSSVNALSVSSLDKFIEFSLGICKKYDYSLYLGYNQVVDPKEISVLGLDKRFAPYVNRAIKLLDKSKAPYHPNSKNYREKLVILRNTFEQKKVTDKVFMENLQSWIQKNDQKRKSDFLTVFPEFKKHFASSIWERLFHPLKKSQRHE